jgi:hypothetical protein
VVVRRPATTHPGRDRKSITVCARLVAAVLSNSNYTSIFALFIIFQDHDDRVWVVVGCDMGVDLCALHHFRSQSAGRASGRQCAGERVKGGVGGG